VLWRTLGFLSPHEAVIGAVRARMEDEAVEVFDAAYVASA
jgi:hypothetical protein